MNYGESLVYWYLRLNGFFPLTNFVIHRSENIEYSSDIDILAIRPPFVSENIGGRDNDWDGWLIDHINSNRTLAVICEVKTGNFEEQRLFPSENIKYAVNRLGITNNKDDIERISKGNAISDINRIYRVFKLFVSTRDAYGNFVYLHLSQIYQFLIDRIKKYQNAKHQDRMFFDSIIIQNLIEIIKMKNEIKF